MVVIKSVDQIKNLLKNFRQQGKTIGFVPTMGALHKGHISLIKTASAQCDIVVCSIFVNPTQFNDMVDLDNYPRTLPEDIALLKSVNCDVLFAPEINEVYSYSELELKRSQIEDISWAMGKTINFGSIDKVMEGAFRKGHFNGVVQVVSKLFSYVEPHKAFFGQKDFQQLAIINCMVKQLGIKIEIQSCPIVRENDGLAMSSRNVLLTKEERMVAPLISKALFQIKESFENTRIDDLKKQVASYFYNQPLMNLEYFEIADSETLNSVTSFKETKSAVALMAVKFKAVRLIDNIILF